MEIRSLLKTVEVECDEPTTKRRPIELKAYRFPSAIDDETLQSEGPLFEQELREAIAAVCFFDRHLSHSFLSYWTTDRMYFQRIDEFSAISSCTAEFVY